MPPMMPFTHPHRERHRSRPALVAYGAWLLVCSTAFAADLSSSAMRAAAPVRGPKPRVMFDPAVTPAGGAGCCGADGKACGHVQPAGFHHAAACRDGMCVPSCPVRPGQFGYYGTQWRRWSDQGVIQTSATEAATPVAPPRSAVPGVQEESPARRGASPADDASLPDDTQPAEPAEIEANPEADDEGAATKPQPPLGAGAADTQFAGPWSRLIAAAHLPEGYEPPAAPVADDQ